jgi:pSer/pThr/pTyr-binding forkhead associated (FHA) protein
MIDGPANGACLVMPDGTRYLLDATCALGRAKSNHLVLTAGAVSRRHALIHLQNGCEFWLIDLGSSNGTFLNARPLRHPVKLTNGDKITVGDTTIRFDVPESFEQECATTTAQKTQRQVEDTRCWLILADLQGFTPLSQTADSSQLAAIVGGWISSCRDIIESNSGTVNQYLGDGIFAYWLDRPGVAESVIACLRSFQKKQQNTELAFRIVLHYGEVAVVRFIAGEQTLIGKHVNYLFRLEKITGSVGEKIGLSEAAKSQIETFLRVGLVGRFEMKGFQGAHALFTVLS